MSRLLSVPNDASAVHFCHVCGSAWTKEREARLCASVIQPCAVGALDIVIINKGYGWYNDDVWVLDRKGFSFQGVKTYRFLYVVTAVTNGHEFQTFNPNSKTHTHGNRIHLYGAAISDDDGCWTTDNGSHHTPELWEPKTAAQKAKAAKLLKLAEPYIGKSFTRLL